MARHDLQTTQLRCPDQTCGGAMVRDECGVFCEVCGFEAVTWADPVDADVPMNVIVRRESNRRRWIASAVAALLLAAIGIPLWIMAAGRGDDLRDPSSLSFAEMRAAFEKGRFPEDLALPTYYRDPELFLLHRERTAQSAMVVWWGQRTKEERLQLLDLSIDSESFELLPFVFEISWFTSASEQDSDVAFSLLQALFASAKRYVDVAWFVCDHFANVTPIPAVQTNARNYVADLVERRRRLGR